MCNLSKLQNSRNNSEVLYCSLPTKKDDLSLGHKGPITKNNISFLPQTVVLVSKVRNATKSWRKWKISNHKQFSHGKNLIQSLIYLQIKYIYG